MMDESQANRIGEWLEGSLFSESYKAYVPQDLPLTPPLEMNIEVIELLSKANRELGRIDEAAKFLPEKNYLLWMYMHKEAVLSSQIEGTRSTLGEFLFDDLTQESAEKESSVEIRNYAMALKQGLEGLKELPISTRLIRRMHSILLQSGPGSTKGPGEIRRDQNWIGGASPKVAIYIPPPPNLVLDKLGNLEKYVNDEAEGRLPLIRAGIVHAQFELIHPFRDGNGRIGRLLVTLMLIADGVITEPLFYPSLFFKQNSASYFHHLGKLSETGNWEAWIKFFLLGVAETAKVAADAVSAISSLFEKDLDKFSGMKQRAGSLVEVHQLLKRHVFVSVKDVARETGLTPTSARSNLVRLMDLGIVREVSERKRNRVYVYHEYLNILNAGTELPANQ